MLSNSKIRHIAGVLIKDNSNPSELKVSRAKDYPTNDFLKLIQGKTVELIEVKKYLNRLVIGQVIAGMDMFERQYQINRINPVIVCQIGDPALEWVCKKRNIKVEIR